MKKNKNERRQRGEINLSVPLCGALQSVYLTAVNDGLQLQGGQQPTVDSFLGDGQGVRDIRRRDARERVGFHHDVRVRNSYCGWRGGERSERLFSASLVDEQRTARHFILKWIHRWASGRCAYILKVCIQHMCPRVPVPLSPLPRHPPLPLAEAVFSEPAESEGFHIRGGYARDSRVKVRYFR